MAPSHTEKTSETTGETITDGGNIQLPEEINGWSLTWSSYGEVRYAGRDEDPDRPAHDQILTATVRSVIAKDHAKGTYSVAVSSSMRDHKIAKDDDREAAAEALVEWLEEHSPTDARALLEDDEEDVDEFRSAGELDEEIEEDLLLEYLPENLSTFALVACSKSKNPGRLPAREKYAGGLFQKAREYAEAVADGYAVLSGKYGAVAPYQELDDYDVSVRDRDADEWGSQVVEELLDVDPYGLDRLIVLAGRDYRDPLAEWLEDLEDADITVEVPLEGLAIGEQMSELDDRLEELSSVWSGPVEVAADGGDPVDQLEISGRDEDVVDERRELVRVVLDYIKDQGSASRSEILEGLDLEDGRAGYESGASVWKHLLQLALSDLSEVMDELESPGERGQGGWTWTGADVVGEDEIDMQAPVEEILERREAAREQAKLVSDDEDDVQDAAIDHDDPDACVAIIPSSGRQCGNGLKSNAADPEARLCGTHADAGMVHRVDDYDGEPYAEIRDALSEAGVRGHRAYQLATLTSDPGELWRVVTGLHDVEIAGENVKAEQLAGLASEVSKIEGVDADDHPLASGQCAAIVEDGSYGDEYRCLTNAYGTRLLCGVHSDAKDVRTIFDEGALGLDYVVHRGKPYLLIENRDGDWISVSIPEYEVVRLEGAGDVDETEVMVGLPRNAVDELEDVDEEEPEVEEVDQPTDLEEAEAFVREVERDYSRRMAAEEISQLVEGGLSSAQALDYWMTEDAEDTYGEYSQSAWSERRGTSHQAISDSVRKAREALGRDD